MRMVLDGLRASEFSSEVATDKTVELLEQIKSMHAVLVSGETIPNLPDNMADEIRNMDMENLHLAVFPTLNDKVVIEVV